MNALAQLRDQIQARFPDATLRIDEPRDVSGVWWLDIKIRESWAILQWQEGQSFGLSNGTQEAGFGEKPEAVYATSNEALEAACKMLNSF